MMRFLAGLITALAISGAAWAQPVNTGHLETELVAETTGIAPGQTIHAALRQKIQEHWHTYWRNPGSSGEASKIEWDPLPSGWKTGVFVWQTPKRLPVGPLVNYGYEGEVLLPFEVTAPADARPGETVTLSGTAYFLVCEEICIPEKGEVRLALPVVSGPGEGDPKWGPAIQKALAAAPKPAGLTAAFEKRAGKLALAIAGAPLKGADFGDAYFFPFTPGVLDHAAPQAIERGPDGLTLAIVPGDEFQVPPGPQQLAGVLALADGRAFEVEAPLGPLPAGTSGLGPPPVKAKPPADAVGLGLPMAVLFALLGGLILNLMPCVFPILAMKAASLAGHAHEAPAARRQGLAFGVGVVLSFVVLAGLLIALQAAGSAVGWGFQLQSPPVVAGLALLMLAVALNLSGVFEVGTSLQATGSGLASRDGLAGSFFTGVLAVVVAAPCTAPFMAPALGWALTQTPLAAMAVFVGLGVGFALPFVAVAFAPALLARLPKPGPWMEAFKKALAFPMYGAAAWLVWVLTQQAGADGLARLLAAAVVLAAGLWLAGIAQRRRMAGRASLPAAVAGGAFVLVAAAAAVAPGYSLAAAGGEDTAGADAVVPYEAYSPERLAALQAEGRPVFVNFTAAWCVSCQVNDRVAISRQGVADAMTAANMAYLKADWTRKDEAIAAELARHGRAGVPLYLVYGVGGGEPRILPNILTEGAVIKAVETAARR